MEKITASDRAFLGLFDEGQLPKSDWNHAAHVRMAWLELERQGGYAKSLEKIRTSIRRYNSIIGTVGYHETLTVVFTRLIHHRRLLGNPDSNFEEFISRNADLVNQSRHLLETYYEPEALQSARARAGYLPPTKKKLPLGGDIRPADEKDTTAMLAIYGPYVRDTPVTFETEVPSERDFAARIRETTKTYPWLVFENEEGVMGYAYAASHRTRAAYRWATEVSTYVHPRAQRLGVGKVLYARLLGELERRGYRTALGIISLPNPASVALHESMGFEAAGALRNIGFKLGRWHDVGWWQKNLGEIGTVPLDLPK